MNNSKVFTIKDLSADMSGKPIEYLEFLKVPSLNCGIYHLQAGQTDPQQPHEEDEIYYVLSGAATFTSDEGDQQLAAGSVIYVAARAEHRFVDVTEDLTLLVVFASN